MSGKVIVKHDGESLKRTPPGKVEVVNINNPNGDFEFDKRLIQLHKDVRTKIDEAKSRIQEHIRNEHRDDDIYKFLSHTTRGRLLCRLFGYRSSKQRSDNYLAQKGKMGAKLKKLEV